MAGSRLCVDVMAVGLIQYDADVSDLIHVCVRPMGAKLRRLVGIT